jgi:hypothetical protein
MASDYTEYSTETAVKIVSACLAANRPDRIIPALLDHRSAESVEAELAAEAARPPERTARAPTSARATNDALAVAIAKRFRNARAAG